VRLTDIVSGWARAVPVDRAGPPRLLAGRAGDADPEIAAVVHDTASVGPGALFCCVPGSRVDGHDLAPKALAAGAAALVVERPLPELDEAVQVLVPSVRAAMGPLAAAFWGHPSHDMTVLGVTGTAGKTTVTHLLRSIMEAAGQPCGLIGTLSGARTTPEGTELQAMLAAERDQGRRAVAMEVSSHGLEMHRVDATRFAVALFTNLSREHLDFHPTMDAYFAAKARLFTPAFTDRAVVCVDDPWGRRLADSLEGTSLTLHRCSLDEAEDLELGPAGARFTWRGQRVELALPGRFNVRNAVAAARTAVAVGVDPEVAAAGLGAAEPVPGRFEPIDVGQPYTVLVDYSHKPDALDQALLAARELVAGDTGRLTVVFGCGGDRDPSKRPVMGEVAARRADLVVLTSDNPRSEDPQAIIRAVESGIPDSTPLVVEPDRRRAIAVALDRAGPGDVVLVAGKGHEATQVIGDEVLPFDDRVVVRDLLTPGEPGRRGGAAGS
jgi:UDP-N-acetylmuramoyl-L-alanyl-D-glutamate--2,6-diaminopimelate ligase